MTIGVAGLRTATLPRWLGWISVAFGLLALAGPLGAVAFLAAPVWAVLAAVTILRARVAGGTPAETAPVS